MVLWCADPGHEIDQGQVFQHCVEDDVYIFAVYIFVFSSVLLSFLAVEDIVSAWILFYLKKKKRVKEAHVLFRKEKKLVPTYQ